MRNITEADMVNKIIDWGLKTNRNIRFTNISCGWCGFTAEVDGDKSNNRWEAYIDRDQTNVVLERLDTTSEGAISVHLELESGL
jgi:hypothetical protein